MDDIWGSKANYEGSSLSMPLDSVISNEELVQAGETSDSYYDLENVVDVQILESDENDPLPLFGDTLGNVRTAKQREFHPGSSVEVMSPPNNDSSSE